MAKSSVAIIMLSSGQFRISTHKIGDVYWYGMNERSSRGISTCMWD